MRGILNHRVLAPHLVFGPPGTGKTMVVVETILQALLTHDDPYLLVCAPSNGAADVLAERISMFADEFLALGRRFPPRWWSSMPDPPTQRMSSLIFRHNSLQRNIQEVKVGVLAFNRCSKLWWSIPNSRCSA